MAAAFAEELPISAHHYFEDYAGRDHGTEVPTGASVIGSAGPPPQVIFQSLQLGRHPPAPQQALELVATWDKTRTKTFN